jgi:SAM-dependent methyltransferase
MDTPTQQQLHGAVRDHYERIILAEPASCCDSDCDCGNDLYQADTTALPLTITQTSLGCGDPITLASLKPGQTVLDLGSGAGMDCFLAAERVGPTGHVIGIDMTPAMLAKANSNKAKLGVEHVEFRQGQIEALPVADNVVDVIISNCVINLAPDKRPVFQEALRVLKPGGRLAVSDMVTLGRFAPEKRADVKAWSECITGAEAVADLVQMMAHAGFERISVRDKSAPEVELAGAPLPTNEPARLFSAQISAYKPT